MKRSELPRPTLQYVIDYNGGDAIHSLGEQVRKYPRLLPVPYLAFCPDCGRLTLQGWRRNLKIFPQLYAVVGRDVEVGEGERAMDAVWGYGLGLAVQDDGILQASPEPAPRDFYMCQWYSLYSDGSQLLSDDFFPLEEVSGITLTMASPTLGTAEYPQSELLFDGGRVLAEMSALNRFCKGEWIALGAVRAPLTVPFEKRFAQGERIVIDGGRLGSLQITVEDLRRESAEVPTWKPRAFAYQPE